MTNLQAYPELLLSLTFIDYKTNDTKQCEVSGLVCDLQEFNENSGDYDGDYDFYLIKHLASLKINFGEMRLQNVVKL
jgi:hypothetical protein